MAIIVAGMFHDRASAERTISDLEAAGYGRDNLGIVMQGEQESRPPAEDTGSHVAGDTTAGAVTGGVAGGVGAAALGLGSLFIPGVGPFIAGGILAAALGGAVGGGLFGALAGLGFDKEEAGHYDTAIRGGRLLLTVRTDEARAPEARAIMRRAGAGFYEGSVTTTVTA